MSAFTKRLILSLCLVILNMVLLNASANADEPGSKTDTGRNSIDQMADQYLKEHPEVKWLRDCDKRDKDNNPIPGHVNPALVVGAGPLGTLYPPTPAAAMGFDTESKLYEGMYYAGLNQLHGFNGQVNSDLKSYTQELQAGDFMARTLQYPPNVANQAKAQAVGQSQAMSNAMGDIAKAQSASAISYCSSFLQNFTTDEGNRWNKIRNGLFMPIAVLLLLPGAVLTQVKAMATQGNPVLSDTPNETNPLEGILRAVVAIFMIPATYLVVNYGIDFSNCITESIASTYKRIMKTNMYQDALGNEIRAFPVRTPRENQNAGTPRVWPSTKIKSVKDYEQNYVTDKEEDPTVGLYNVPKNKTDEAMPAGAVAARQLSFGANAALTAAWNVLCAFQMAYLSYLFFVGPIAAALWVWPMKHFRNALPNWIEGVITLCFWSLFWNTAILLMACFKGVDESSTMLTSALNFLATSSVKFAFDFAGLVKAAGQEAAKKATDKAGAAGKSGHDGKGQKHEAKDKTSSTGNTTSTGIDNTNINTNNTNNTTDANSNNTNNINSNNTNSTNTTSDDSVNNTINKDTSMANIKAVEKDGSVTNNPSISSAPPPLTITSLIDSNLSQLQSVQLGNYTLSRGIDEKGNPHDWISTKDGIILADLSSREGTTTKASDNTLFTCRNDANGTYSYADAYGQVHTAQLAAPEDRVNCGIAGGKLSSDYDSTKDSLALRSEYGTILLENGGTTALIPNAAHHGYDSYQLNQDPNNGTFALLDGRQLKISQNEDGSRQVALKSDKGIEEFTVMPDGDGGYGITHALNGDPAGSTRVTMNGGVTTYANYDSANNLTDIENISGNTVSSTMFDPRTQTVLGVVESTYEPNGNSATTYRQGDDTLTCTSTNEIRPNGGYVDRVYDAFGEKVSVQEKIPRTDGGYTIELSRYANAEIVSSELQTFDANSKLISHVTEPTPTANNPTQNAYATTDSTVVAATTYQPSHEYSTSYQPSSAEQTLSYSTSYQPSSAEQTLSYSTSYQPSSAEQTLSYSTSYQPSSVEQAHSYSTAQPETRAFAELIRTANTTQNQIAGDAIRTTSAPPPMICRDSIDTAEVASLESTQESLQQQLANTSSKIERSRTISEILHFESNTSNESEALANTHVNYTLLSTMLQKGLTYQATQLVNVVERDIQTLRKNPEAEPLIHAYIQLLKKHNLTEQANAYSAHLVAASNAPSYW